MIGNLLKKVFGTRNERLIKKMSKIVEKVNGFEAAIQALSDEALGAKTDEFRERLKGGETRENLLPEAFAVVREASVRTLGLRHFDVQIIGGVVLHAGKIAEMRTGEGKTLVATLAAYLNALSGKGVHIITVNDYLAKRDAEWMAPIYRFLGLTVGVNLTNMPPEEKCEAYNADITYGTNNEFGFDYLRDNMAFSLEDKVQRALHYSIVDEVDSILIDEARTPLIISGPAEGSSELYKKIDKLIPKLVKQEEEDGPGDYSVNEKDKQAFLTEAGHERIETLLVEAGILKEGESLYDPGKISLNYHINAALRAHALYQRDVDYIVKNDQVIIVDEHTGRLMDGRRWSEGLHQAVEARENVTIQQENQTLASITFQNYFRLYEKLAGMTGTADTEAYEFQQIYGLEVVVIPTNEPVIRIDKPDQVYLNKEGKFNAIVEEVKKCSAAGQPILLGTASIETSEYLSKLLTTKKIKHQVLNAKFHEKEAKIVAQAGQPGRVTIATNMAGRGTDIVLGGNIESEIKALKDPSEKKITALRDAWKKSHEQVIKAGGLHVICSERHESRRIDNQLRGRSGRQGDPGSSQFYLSLEDNLMRIFASDRMGGLMRKLGMKEDEAIQHTLVTRAIENAQRKVEGHNFDIRKQLLEFDDVANDQRKVVYRQRAELMEADDISEAVTEVRRDVVNGMIDQYIPPESLEEQWNVPGLEKQVAQDFNLELPLTQWLEKDESLHEETLRESILNATQEAYQQKEASAGSEAMRHLEKSVMLQTIDTHWKEHLAAMDYLRQGIHLRGYAQKNPVQEFKRESFNMFTDMLEGVQYAVISMLSLVQIQTEQDMDAYDEQYQPASYDNMQFLHSQATGSEEMMEDAESEVITAPETYVRETRKIGRNEPCHCGSGKKYKLCHGKID